MKHTTAVKEIYISHWSYILNGRLLSIFYENCGEHKRHVKFLQPSPMLDEYLLHHLEKWVSIKELCASGADWVNEEPFFEAGIEVPIEVDDDFIRFCARHGITVFEYLHGLSCFFCNPANHDLILKILKSSFGEMSHEQDIR